MLIILFTDYFILVFSFWTALSISYNELFFSDVRGIQVLIILSPLIALPIFYLFNLYKSWIRYTGYQCIKIIITSISVYTVIWFFIVLLVSETIRIFDFLIVNWLISVFLIGGIRIILRWLVEQNLTSNTRAIIYGAGSAGIQLQSAIDKDPAINIIGFIDDNPELKGINIGSYKVYQPDQISTLIKSS